MNEKVRDEIKTAVENLGIESKKIKEDIRSVRNGLDNWKTIGHININ